MSQKYNNLITTTAGFHYPAPMPLDDREVVSTYEDLKTLVDSNQTYDGIEVYVEQNKTSYKLIDGQWVAVITENIMSNPNYFMNPFFQINQRGTTEITNETYSSSAKYRNFIADRWGVYSDTLVQPWSIKRSEGVVTIDNTQGEKRIILRQMMLPQEFELIRGKDITFSIYGQLGERETKIYSLTTNIAEIVPGDVRQYGSTKFADDSESFMRVSSPQNGTCLFFDIYVWQGDEFKVHWAKLEFGTKYTPIMPINYSDELDRCKRYYQEFYNTRLPIACHSVGNLEWYVSLSPSMTGDVKVAIEPSMITIYKWGGGGTITVASDKPLGARYIHQNGFNLYTNTATSATETCFGALCNLSGKSGNMVPMVAYTELM